MVDSANTGQRSPKQAGDWRTNSSSSHALVGIIGPACCDIFTLMSSCSLQKMICQVKRTGTSFFFDLDVTQSRSADAILGAQGAVQSR